MVHTQGNVSLLQAVLSEHYHGNIKSQSSTSKSEEVKAKENTVAHDVADKCKIGRRNQTGQSVHKPCAACTLSKSHEAVRMGLRQIIWKAHRLSIYI